MTKVWMTACYLGYYKVGVDGKWSWEYVGRTHKAQSILFGVKRRVSLLELYDTLEKKLEIDSSVYELVLRCPSLHGSDYPPCIIKDDCAVNALISCWKAPIVYITVKEKSIGDHINLMSNDNMNRLLEFVLNDNVEECISPSMRIKAGIDGEEGGAEEFDHFVDEESVEDAEEFDHFIDEEEGSKVHADETVLASIRNVDDANAIVHCLDDKLHDVRCLGDILKESNPIGPVEVETGAAACIVNVDTSLTMYRPLSSVRIPDVEDVHVNGHFETKFDLICKLQNLALKYHFEFFTPRSTKKLCIMICVQKQCEWRMRATNYGDLRHFVIRSYNFKHSCSLSVQKIDHKQATTAVIGNLLVPKLLDRNRVFKVKDVISDFYQELGYTVSSRKAFNGLQRARVLIRGSPSMSFGKLPRFFHALESRNPGTVTSIETVGDSDVFLYSFMALGASISGYKSSIRPVISVDGTFLTGFYKGTLIVAICQDGNHQLFPLAFGVVNSENNESWTWFFQKLKAITGDSRELAILADSIKHGFNEVFQNACHGRSRAYTVEKFKTYFNALCAKHGLIRGYLEEENFALFSDIREILQRWFAERRDEALQCETILTLKMEDQIIETLNELHELNSLKKVVVKAISVRCKYEVCVGQSSYIVDFETRTCTCRKFDLEKMSCVHSVPTTKRFLNILNIFLIKKVLPPVFLEESKHGRRRGTDREKGAGEHRKKGRKSKKTRETRKESIETRKKYKKKRETRNEHPENYRETSVRDEHVLQSEATSKKSKKTRATRKNFKKTLETINEPPKNCGETSVRDEQVDCEMSTEFESVDTGMEFEKGYKTLLDIVRETHRKRPKFGSIKSLLA